MTWVDNIRRHGFKVAKPWMRFNNTKYLFLKHSESKRLFQIEYPYIRISFEEFGFNDKGQYPRIDMEFKSVDIHYFLRQIDIKKQSNPDFCLDSFISNLKLKEV